MKYLNNEGSIEVKVEKYVNHLTEELNYEKLKNRHLSEHNIKLLLDQKEDEMERLLKMKMVN